MKIFLKNTRQFEKKFKFKFLKPLARLHSNGFVSVTVDWTNLSCTDFPKFKYPNLIHRCYGGDVMYSKKRYLNIQTASFEFPELSKEDTEGLRPFWFDIVLGAENEEDEKANQYDYLFFEQVKYGVVCWFGPRGWEDWTNTIQLT